MYVVEKGAGAIPVYTVRPERQDGPARTLHRDLLLPCGFLSEEEQEPKKSMSVAKPKTRRQNHTQLDDRSLYSDEEDRDDPGFYPVRLVEAETRILEPLTSCEEVAVDRNGAHTSTEYLQNECVDTIEVSPDEVVTSNTPPLSSLVEGATQIAAHPLPNITSTNIKTAEGYPVSDRDMGEIKRRSELQQEGEETERNAQQSSTIEGPTSLKAVAGLEAPELLDNSTMAEVDFSLESGLRLGKIYEDNQEGDSQPAEVNIPLTLEEKAKSHVSESPSVTLRTSERVRKPPGRFTYPQLGKPLISFAQTILDGFNRALVETFEGNCSYEDGHEGTHASLEGEGVTQLEV